MGPSHANMDHAESLVATYQPAFQMLLTSRNLLKLTPLFSTYYEAGKKIPECKKIRKGAVLLSALQGWKRRGSACGSPFLVAVSISIANALNLSQLIDDERLNEVCNFDADSHYLYITAIGSIGLSLLWGAATAHVMEKFPSFRLPYCLDTEVYFKPQKFSQ
jgi:hypothetical protein